MYPKTLLVNGKLDKPWFPAGPSFWTHPTKKSSLTSPKPFWLGKRINVHQKLWYFGISRLFLGQTQWAPLAGGRLHDSDKIKAAWQGADGGHEYKTAQSHSWLSWEGWCWISKSGRLLFRLYHVSRWFFFLVALSDLFECDTAILSKACLVLVLSCKVLYLVSRQLNRPRMNRPEHQELSKHPSQPVQISNIDRPKIPCWTLIWGWPWRWLPSSIPLEAPCRWVREALRLLQS